MAELDGVWEVERVSGALPPLNGVRKEIRGRRGRTKLGRLPGAPFEVVGLTLRYRFPPGLVDLLEPDGEGRFSGRATLFGREFGRFRMRRVGSAA